MHFSKQSNSTKCLLIQTKKLMYFIEWFLKNHKECMSISTWFAEMPRFCFFPCNFFQKICDFFSNYLASVCSAWYYLRVLVFICKKTFFKGGVHETTWGAVTFLLSPKLYVNSYISPKFISLWSLWQDSLQNTKAVNKCYSWNPCREVPVNWKLAIVPIYRNNVRGNYRLVSITSVPVLRLRTGCPV